jgi:hypothetical protein
MREGFLIYEEMPNQPYIVDWAVSHI